MDSIIKFIDNSILRYIQDVSSYLFFEYIISWYFAISIIICLPICLIISKKFKSGGKLTAVISLVLVLMLTIICHTAVSLRTNNDHLRIGIAGLYTDNDDGGLSVSNVGKDFQLKIYKLLQYKLNNDVSTFSKIAKPEIIEVEVPKYQLRKYNTATIGSLFKEKRYNKKYSIIIYGTMNRNGEIKTLQASLDTDDAENFNDCKLNIFNGYDDDYDILMTYIAKQMPIDVLAEYIYAFISQSLSVSAAEHFKSVALGISMIDDSERVISNICKSINHKTQDSKLLIATKHSELNFKINKSMIYSKFDDNYKAAREILEALKINLFHPYWCYEDFKKYYNKSYSAQVAKNILELYEMNPDDKAALSKAKILKERLAYYDHSIDVTLLDHFMSIILESSDFENSVSMYKELSAYYPSQSVVYLYWGDTLKYYKSEIFDLNLQFVDESINKYTKAIECDRKWLLIPQKIYFTQFLRYSKDKNTSKAKKALENAERLTPSALGRDFEQYVEGL